MTEKGWIGITTPIASAPSTTTPTINPTQMPVSTILPSPTITTSPTASPQTNNPKGKKDSGGFVGTGG